MIPRPPISTLFPYTTLFRSRQRRTAERHHHRPEDPVLAGAVDACRLQQLVGDALDELLERSEEHTSELQSQSNLVCRLLLEKKKLLHLFYIRNQYLILSTNL